MSTTESSIPSPSKGSSPPCLIRYCGNFRGCIPPGHEGVMRSGGWCLRGQESGGGTGKRGGGGGGKGAYSVCAWPSSYDHRPSHPYYAGTEHVGFSPTRQTLLAPSAKRREVFGESHEGGTASFQEPLVRRTSAPCAYLFVDDSTNELLCVLV